MGVHLVATVVEEVHREATVAAAVVEEQQQDTVHPVNNFSLLYNGRNRAFHIAQS